MRLFIAINFTEEVKRQLYKTIQDLKKQSKRGNFTRIENMHLTLAFLGEVPSERVMDLTELMQKSVAGHLSFSLEVNGFGKFVTRGERLYWCGITENKALVELQKEIVSRLNLNGFTVDDKPFKPHITLGRRCLMKKDFQEKEFGEAITPVEMKVEKIELMLSEHIEGKLTYTSLGEVKLKKEK